MEGVPRGVVESESREDKVRVTETELEREAMEGVERALWVGKGERVDVGERERVDVGKGEREVDGDSLKEKLIWAVRETDTDCVGISVTLGEGEVDEDIVSEELGRGLFEEEREDWGEEENDELAELEGDKLEVGLVRGDLVSKLEAGGDLDAEFDMF